MPDLTENEAQLLLEVGEIKGMVKSVLIAQEAQAARMNDHDARIRRLETGRARDMGWAAGVGAAVSAGIALLKGKIGL